MVNTFELECEEQLTIEHVDSLYSQLDNGLKKHDKIVLIADRVQFCDTAALQLILTFMHDTEKQDRASRVTWKDPSEVILNVASLLGLVEALGLSNYKK